MNSGVSIHMAIGSLISTVIPVFNEEESIPKLFDELTSVANENNYELEVIFVDDGSTDSSWDEIEKLAAESNHVKAIRFRRNFGKADALNAGFEIATGHVVFTLDADLQDDPIEIPRFLEKMQKESIDVISGWKKKRYDPWHKVLPSRVFNWLVSKLTGVKLHDHNCGFKCYRGEVVKDVHLYGEMHRFVPVLAAARGWTTGEIVVNHRPRQHGKSKYGVRRIFKEFLDLLTVYVLTSFRQRPQHLLGALGLLFFAVGGVGLSILTGIKIYTKFDADDGEFILHTSAYFYYSIVAILLGAQCLSVGVLAELTNSHSKEPTYAVSERLGQSNEESEL